MAGTLPYSVTNKFTDMKVSDYKKEFEKYTESMEIVNAMRSDIECNCTDVVFLQTKKAKEDALKAYTNELNRCVLEDREYNQLQKEVVRLALHEFARVHKAPSFATWYDENEKDTQAIIIDSVQRLCSHVVNLYKDFMKGYMEAKDKRKAKMSRAEQIKALQAQIAALQAQE